MTGLRELRAGVAAAYDRLGMPSWPDPHPDLASPRDEEYSRVTEPERYRIVHARARVWTECLGAVPGIEVTSLAPAALDEDGHPDRFDRGVRIASRSPGTVPLFLLETDAPLSEREGTLAVLRIAVGRPELGLDILPDCGCDACDSGSADLLDTIDDTVGAVIGGPFVMLRGRDWRMWWHPDGSASEGTARGLSHTGMERLCRRLADGEDAPLPRGTEAWVGRSWFD
ncbi:DUF6226 domain-containing protein [Saccharomonospora xinjiangensis]|uniref:DUF6226 family protein n=1 Tax=Saccharomonospora xinjiangensis TaxID=75294 RepID=UPI0010706994|nr:DUF6226 family protein [Saccharomonospora xinjiangensis]QBQ60670.1 hypothetical protein EYD13_11585 [Saccharomonospora xinjiangensis]